KISFYIVKKQLQFMLTTHHQIINYVNIILQENDSRFLTIQPKPYNGNANPILLVVIISQEYY
ncbi:hypothetical protein RPO40_08160, partial [Mammaliicoccus fleurettii]|nr:hypothetical protein [Mammaliicoccus fleurettii]